MLQLPTTFKITEHEKLIALFYLLIPVDVIQKWMVWFIVFNATFNNISVILWW